jgi:uncharacterized membrane protein
MGTIRRLNKIVTPLFYILSGTSILCVLLLLIRADRLEESKYLFLVWNLFLAWLPLAASTGAVLLAQGKPRFASAVGIAGLAVAWLLFFPNAPYLTTDFIHLIMSRDYTWGDQRSLIIWFDIVVFFLFSWTGLLLGYLSMQHIHAIVNRFMGRSAGAVFVVAASFLGGFGIYLGRIFRLNSWDVVFSPFRLLQGVAQGLDRGGAVFSLLFGIMILIVYLSLYSLRRYRFDEYDS